MRDLCCALNNEGGNNHNRNDERNVNSTETNDNGSVPGEVSLAGATSVGSQSRRAGDAFAPRDNRSTGSGSRRA